MPLPAISRRDSTSPRHHGIWWSTLLLQSSRQGVPCLLLPLLVDYGRIYTSGAPGKIRWRSLICQCPLPLLTFVLTSLRPPNHTSSWHRSSLRKYSSAEKNHPPNSHSRNGPPMRSELPIPPVRSTAIYSIIGSCQSRHQRSANARLALESATRKTNVFSFGYPPRSGG